MREETKKINQLYAKTKDMDGSESPVNGLERAKGVRASTNEHRPKRLYQQMQQDFEENIVKREEYERELKLK